MAIKYGSSQPTAGRWSSTGITAIKYGSGTYKFVDNIYLSSYGISATYWDSDGTKMRALSKALPAGKIYGYFDVTFEQPNYTYNGDEGQPPIAAMHWMYAPFNVMSGNISHSFLNGTWETTEYTNDGTVQRPIMCYPHKTSPCTVRFNFSGQSISNGLVIQGQIDVGDRGKGMNLVMTTNFSNAYIVP